MCVFSGVSVFYCVCIGLLLFLSQQRHSVLWKRRKSRNSREEGESEEDEESPEEQEHEEEEHEEEEHEVWMSPGHHMVWVNNSVL